MAKLIIVLKEKRMLYKKYHRNFIRQFKLGTNIIIGCESGVVTEEPSLGGIGRKEYIQIRLDAVPTCEEDNGYRAILMICANKGKLPNEWIRFV